MIGGVVSSQGIPFGLHYFVFIPALMGHATVEQQAKWVYRAWNFEIIGTYAQVSA